MLTEDESIALKVPAFRAPPDFYPGKPLPLSFLLAKRRQGVSFFRRGKPAEKTVGLPGRRLGSIGDTQREFLENIIELRGSGQIDRLLRVVRNAVVALGVPIFKDFAF